MHRVVFYACLATLLCALTADLAFAQGGNASINGVIRDPAGARVPGATVNATNVDTGLKFSGISNDTGAYQILQVPPGTYDLEASAAGFKTGAGCYDRAGLLAQSPVAEQSG